MEVVDRQIAELTVPAAPEQLKLVRALVGSAAENAGCRSDIASQIVIAVNEACMNVIQHAYCGEPDGEITVEIARNGDVLEIQIKDSAPLVDVSTVKCREIDDLQPNGLGTFFIDEIMDTWVMGQLDGQRGNFLKMTKIIE